MKRRRQPGTGSFERCVRKVARRGAVDDPAAVCAASKIRAGEDLHHNLGDYTTESSAGTDAIRKLARRLGVSFATAASYYSANGGSAEKAARAYQRDHKHNPAELAAEAFERTHGYPAREEMVFIDEEHYHGYLPAWGKLVALVIVPDGENKGVELHSFQGAMLAFSEHKELPQLFIVGGDQALNGPTLRQFGIKRPHEQEYLGSCVDIVYDTIKTHLGKEGGDADYKHQFAEESAGHARGDKRRHVRVLKSPRATYDVLNKHITLWGGVYSNDPEGIRD